MFAVKVLLRKLGLIELGEGSLSPSKVEVYSYGFIENRFRIDVSNQKSNVCIMVKKLMTMPSPMIW